MKCPYCKKPIEEGDACLINDFKVNSGFQKGAYKLKPVKTWFHETCYHTMYEEKYNKPCFEELEKVK